MGSSTATGTIVQRLVAARWLLIAALAAIASLGWIAGLHAGIVASAAVFVVAVAALAPRRSPGRQWTEREGGTAGLGAVPLTAEALAGAVTDPLVLFGRDGLVIHVNDACSYAFPGLRPGISLPLRFRAPEMQEMLRNALDSGKPASIDYAEKVPIERFFRVGISPVGPDGGLLVMIFRDQSETRRIDRMRADFIANASHELRTPLASIAGFVETLRGPARDDAAARERFLQIMQAQTERMARLIDDLLSLSRLEMRPYLGAAERLDLKPLVGGVIDALKPLAEESGVEIRTDFPAAPLAVAGSRDELIQVFENLIENACKYGQSGGVVEVSATPAGQQNGIDVSVRDHGQGIPEEHIPRLTERFYRVDVETSRGQKGTGLGLAIVKHILTRHHARLTVASKPGEGATFTVHFPPVP